MIEYEDNFDQEDFDSSDDDFEEVSDYDCDLLDENNCESETEFCPVCGAPVYEDAIRCDTCGEYITPVSDSKPKSKLDLTLLIIAAVIIAIILAFVL